MISRRADQSKQRVRGQSEMVDTIRLVRGRSYLPIIDSPLLEPENELVVTSPIVRKS